MIEDYTAWRFWFDVMQLAGTVVIGVYVWWDRRKKVTDKRFKALEVEVAGIATSIKGMTDADVARKTECAKHHERTESLEKSHAEMEKANASLQADIRHLPSRQELAELAKQLSKMTAELGKLDGRLTGINRAVDLLNQHHLRVSE